MHSFKFKKILIMKLISYICRSTVYASALTLVFFPHPGTPSTFQFIIVSLIGAAAAIDSNFFSKPKED